MWLTVGLFNEYIHSLEDAFSGLKFLLIGGDALVPSLVSQALAKESPPQRLINGYGPTETTTFAATYEIKSVASGTTSIPIGKPISGTQIYVLDDGLSPVPRGEIGEICIGGDGVARGYANQEAMTSEVFIADPFARVPGGRLYRTGDLGRWGESGDLEFIGRRDQQVKIRGFRIELGEVEAALRRFPDVCQSVAIVQEDRPGGKRLVAYVVLAPMPDPCLDQDSNSTSTNLDMRCRQIREQLRQLLPSHLVPASIIRLDALPLTPNGKIDRAALPKTVSQEYSSSNHVAPSTPTENALSIIWKEALKTDRLGIDDNFFELGGDSMTIIEVIGNVADLLQVDLAFTALYENPTLRQFAISVETMLAKRSKQTPIDPALIPS